MLRSLVIASGSGLVLFEKEWTKEFELVRFLPREGLELKNCPRFLQMRLSLLTAVLDIFTHLLIHWTQGAKWGALIRSLEEFAAQCVGMNVTYMDFPNGTAPCLNF